MQTVTSLRILLANEPRAYREALGAALGGLRPSACVRVVEPGQLEETLERYQPHLLICSQLTPSVERLPLAWLVLYREGTSHAELRLDGQWMTTSQVQLDDLLALVDRTALLVRGG
jgi:hypothetical protein